MKIISKNGKKILKMSKKEWIEIGKQYKFAIKTIRPEKIEKVIQLLTELSTNFENLSQ
jgi:hypothetical protein